MKTPLALALLLAAPVGAQTPSPSPATTPSPLPSITLPAPLARVLTDYEAAWARKDAAALAALFAEDGFVLSSGVPAVRGRAAIERHYTGQGGPLALRAFAYATEGIDRHHHRRVRARARGSPTSASSRSRS